MFFLNLVRIQQISTGLVLLFVSCGLWGETYVSGNVSGVWDPKGSPYIATESIHVNFGEILRIEPGVRVQFYEDANLKVSDQNAEQPGQLIAKGSVEDSIYFEAFDRQRGWKGLVYQNSGDNDTLDYCVIKDVNAVNVDGALSCVSTGIVTFWGGAPVLSHTSIRSNISEGLNCVRSIFELVDSAPQIKYCRITGNQVRKVIDMHSGCDLRIHNTLIANNRIEGIVFGDNSLPGNLLSRKISMINVTLSANHTDSPSDNLVNSFPVFIDIKNSILWELGVPLTFGEQDQVQIWSSDIDTEIGTLWAGKDWQNEDMSSLLIEWVDTNLSQDPAFTNPDQGDFTLQPDSPCTDTGQPVLIETDREDPENPGMALWPSSGSISIDMGAYGGWRETGDVWQTQTSAHIDQELTRESPSEFRLGDNYPNPFNPGTKIGYFLPVRSHVRLTVLNMAGQEVSSLENGFQPAGAHEVTWDGTNQSGRPVSSGIYYYRLEAGSFHQVKKMTLLR